MSSMNIAKISIWFFLFHFTSAWKETTFMFWIKNDSFWMIKTECLSILEILLWVADKSVIKLELNWVERNQLNSSLSSSWDWVDLSQLKLNSKLSWVAWIQFLLLNIVYYVLKIVYFFSFFSIFFLQSILQSIW